MSTWDDWSAGHVYTCRADRTTLIGATARELRHLINEHLRTHHALRVDAQDHGTAPSLCPQAGAVPPT